jgi:hypothetical protein
VALLFRWSIAIAAALAMACSTVSSTQAGAACGPSGYAYAGVQAAEKGHGISAVLTSLGAPAVESGHVAGWIGVGAPGEGPGGSDEWIQVGLNSLPDTGNTLYYEVMRPGSGLRYGVLVTDVPTGRRIRVAVLEMASAPGVWRVWVDGRPVTQPIALGSGSRLTPMAMGESWGGGRVACNSFKYRFARVAIAAARGGSWQPALDSTVLQDPGYRVVRRTTATFDASAVTSPAGKTAHRLGRLPASSRPAPPAASPRP